MHESLLVQCISISDHVTRMAQYTEPVVIRACRTSSDGLHVVYRIECACVGLVTV